jgi:hypothetical protein
MVLLRGLSGFVILDGDEKIPIAEWPKNNNDRQGSTQDRRLCHGGVAGFSAKCRRPTR